MDYNKAALELHSKFPGKIAVQSLCECKDRDALSTACFALGMEKGMELLENLDGVYGGIFITKDYELHYTEGLKSRIKITETPNSGK